MKNKNNAYAFLRNHKSDRDSKSQDSHILDLQENEPSTGQSGQVSHSKGALEGLFRYKVILHMICHFLPGIFCQGKMTSSFKMSS